jgi:hypothetical protein
LLALEGSKSIHSRPLKIPCQRKKCQTHKKIFDVKNDEKTVVHCGIEKNSGQQEEEGENMEVHDMTFSLFPDRGLISLRFPFSILTTTLLLHPLNIVILFTQTRIL